MKISELDYSKLTEEDMYNLIMSGLVDYSTQNPTEETKADAIVVLGCSPRPLKGRVKKMMELEKKGYADVIIFSGGRGWQKLVRQNPERKPELIQAIKNVITRELLGDNPGKIELDTYNKFNEQMKKLIGKKHKDMAYQERMDEGKMEMTEEEFMQLITITNGGIKKAKIYHEPFSTNTKENVIYIGKLFDTIKRERGIDVKRLMVVTSAFHCTRSKLNFKKNFPNLSVSVCPSTEDLEELGLSISPDLMKDEKNHRQITGEAKKIIDYSRKGDIEDVELTELVSIEIARDIESRQRQENIRE